MTDDDIDNEILTPVDFQEPEPKKKTVKRVKPSVEGINAPKTTRSTVVVRSASVDEREQATSDFRPVSSRLIPDRVGKKSRHIGRWLGIFIILVILIGAAYEAYVWNINRHISKIPSYSNQTLSSPDSSVMAASTSTSTLDVLPVATSTPTSATTTTTTPISAMTPQLTVNQTPTGYLNVRSGPSSSSRQVAQVHPGEVYVYTATQSGWYKITLTNGSSGWVSGQYITLNK